MGGEDENEKKIHEKKFHDGIEEAPRSLSLYGPAFQLYSGPCRH